MKTIFNTKNVDPMTQPLFLGKDLGVQRYDVLKYPVFKDLDSKQMMNFWRPEEIELKKDRGDFKEMSDNEKFEVPNHARQCNLSWCTNLARVRYKHRARSLSYDVAVL